MSGAVGRADLPRTFTAFLGRFDRLNEVQRRAIPLILAGRDAILCSPTASGKTEAYAAPLAEMALARGGERLSFLIVSPTRALANDLKRRLEGRMEQVGVSLGRYTGEHKERRGGELAQIAITTPESLDSLLARRPRELATLRGIVLDEIHVLDGSARGDQLRILLHRLEKVVGRKMQRIAASATLDAPAELAGRYLEDAAVVAVAQRRRILAKPFTGSAPGDIARHLDELAGVGFRKVLVFCNRRRDVETLATELAGKTRFAGALFAHHGSLSRTTRLRAERGFLTAPAAVCFATLTLELGIDIGTVDYVLLAAPPSDVSSLLQRIGRGSRRGEATRAGFAFEDAAERHLMETMLRQGARGELRGRPYGFRPGVLVQQAMVLACSQGSVRPHELENALPREILAELAPASPAAILAAMVAAGKLERARGGAFVPSEDTEIRYGRGVLHANIDAELTAEVVDRLTGDVIGAISGERRRKLQLGGRGRKVVKQSADRILTDSAGGARAASFTSRGSPSISLRLARVVVEGLGVGERVLFAFPHLGSHILLHGLGTVGGLLLAHQMESLLGPAIVQESSPFALHLARPPLGMPPLDEEAVALFLRKHQAKLEGLGSLGPYHKVLPEELRRASLRKVLGFDELLAFARDAELKVGEAQDLEDVEAAVGL